MAHTAKFVCAYKHTANICNISLSSVLVHYGEEKSVISSINGPSLCECHTNVEFIENLCILLQTGDSIDDSDDKQLLL